MSIVQFLFTTTFEITSLGSVSKQSVGFEMIFKCKIYIKFVFFVGAKSSKLRIHHPLLKFISSESIEFDPQIQMQI